MVSGTPSNLQCKDQLLFRVTNKPRIARVAAPICKFSLVHASSAAGIIMLADPLRFLQGQATVKCTVAAFKLEQNSLVSSHSNV